MTIAELKSDLWRVRHTCLECGEVGHVAVAWTEFDGWESWVTQCWSCEADLPPLSELIPEEVIEAYRKEREAVQSP